MGDQSSQDLVGRDETQDVRPAAMFQIEHQIKWDVDENLEQEMWARDVLEPVCDGNTVGVCGDIALTE